MRISIPTGRHGPAVLLIAVATVLSGHASHAQAPTPLSREQAVTTALSLGARAGLARADTLAAFAGLLTASALQNPVLATSYTRDVPRYHASIDLPLDFPRVRRTRIGAAEAGRDAAQYRFQLDRATIALDVDTTYTRALAAGERARLSRRTAQDADSLRRMAVARRDAGDASDLDVELASVNAGQQANVAAADSLAAIAALLDLQATMGLAAEQVVIAPSDSLTTPPADGDGDGDGGARRGAPGAPPRATLPVAAAQAALTSAEIAARLQHRSVYGAPSVTVGFDYYDPASPKEGLLPVVGIALPLPFLNRNQGPIAQAVAERERARAELALARVESGARIARAERERAGALDRVARDQRLLASAERVSRMSLAAYREGASSLPNVLEAQRNARDILAQYVDDLAAAWIATATLRVATLSPIFVSRLPINP